MKMLIFVLNDVEKLEALLEELSKMGLRGATIINSTGMARSLYGHQSVMMNSLRVLLDSDHEENKTIFTVVDQQQEEIFYKAVDKVVGSLSEPNTGIIFTVPVDSVNGLIPSDQ